MICLPWSLYHVCPFIFNFRSTAVLSMLMKSKLVGGPQESFGPMITGAWMTLLILSPSARSFWLVATTTKKNYRLTRFVIFFFFHNEIQTSYLSYCGSFKCCVSDLKMTKCPKPWTGLKTYWGFSCSLFLYSYVLPCCTMTHIRQHDGCI